MRESRRLHLLSVLSMTIILTVLGSGAHDAHAQEPVLERYVFQVGSGDGAGTEATLHDRFFGHGTAQSRLVFTGPEALGDPEGTGSLLLRVWRRVEPGEITFALLVFRVEVRGFAADGTTVYRRNLRGFTFGDSASGQWRRLLDDLPPSLVRLAVTFIGNYE